LGSSGNDGFFQATVGKKKEEIIEHVGTLIEKKGQGGGANTQRVEEGKKGLENREGDEG